MCGVKIPVANGHPNELGLSWQTQIYFWVTHVLIVTSSVFVGFFFTVKIVEIKRKISLLPAEKHCCSRSPSSKISSIVSAQQRKWKGQLLHGWQEVWYVISYRIFCVCVCACGVCFNGGWSWQLSGGFLCNSAFRWQRTVRAGSPHWRRTCLLIS